MTRLTSIVWPRIKARVTEDIVRFRCSDQNELMVIEAAVLMEAGWTDLVDQIWVTTVPPAVAVRRLAERNGLIESEARDRLASQLSNEERQKRAHTVISTNRPKHETQKLVYSVK